MKKVQIGNTNYEVNINYAEKGESLQRLIEILAYHRIKKNRKMIKSLLIMVLDKKLKLV